MPIAEVLVERGKEVTIMEESGHLGLDIELTHRWVVLNKLKNAGVRMIKDTKVLEVTYNGLYINRAGSQEFVESDTVAIVGITLNNQLAQELTGGVTEIHCIGDCAEPGKIMEAVTAGFLVGQNL